MTHIPFNELNNYNTDEYSIIRIIVMQEHMSLAGEYIKRVREFHNKLGCFVKHTCACRDNSTIWYFIYKHDEYRDYDIPNRTDDIWESVFTGDDSSCGGYLGSSALIPSNAHPCMCPFSVK